MFAYSRVLVSLLLCSILLESSVWAQTQCPAAPPAPEDRRTDKTTLRIATFNAEWLFLNRNNCPGTGCPWTTPAEAARHMQAVADEIVLINADILNMAEVQDCNVLQSLLKLMEDKNMGYKPYLRSGTDTATGQNVALLTRVDPVVALERTENRVTYPIPGSKCGDDMTGSTGVSKHYYTYFNVEGLTNPLSIFGMHFLAFPDRTDRCVQREAQAQVIANLVAADIAKGRSVVVLGDLNDFDPSVRDASNSKPISAVLNILKDPVKSKPGNELANVASFIQGAQNVYSCWYDRVADCQQGEDELSLIDHVLISTDLVPMIVKSWADHSYAPMCQTVESDHWPVIVQLDLSKNPDFNLASNKHNTDADEIPAEDAKISREGKLIAFGVGFVVCVAVVAALIATRRREVKESEDVPLVRRQ